MKKRKARKARNPKTGQKVDVPPKNVVTFKPGKEMEERVRQMTNVPDLDEEEAVGAEVGNGIQGSAMRTAASKPRPGAPAQGPPRPFLSAATLLKFFLPSADTTVRFRLNPRGPPCSSPPPYRRRRAIGGGPGRAPGGPLASRCRPSLPGLGRYGLPCGVS